MNEEEIRNMEAGPELDRMIEEQLFGKVVLDEYPFRPRGQKGMRENEVLTREAERRHYEWYRYQCASVASVRPFSTDIAAAWEVVEKISETVGPTSVCWGIYGGQGNKASVMMMYHDGPGVVAPTAPLAICRAALLAVMGDES